MNWIQQQFMVAAGFNDHNKVSYHNRICAGNIKFTSKQKKKKKTPAEAISMPIDGIRYNPCAPQLQPVSVTLPSEPIHEHRESVERKAGFEWDNCTDDLLVTGQHAVLLRNYGLTVRQLWSRAYTLGYSFRFSEELKKAKYHQMFWSKHPETIQMLIWGMFKELETEYFVRPTAMLARLKKLGYKFIDWNTAPVKA